MLPRRHSALAARREPPDKSRRCCRWQAHGGLRLDALSLYLSHETPNPKTQIPGKSQSPKKPRPRQLQSVLRFSSVGDLIFTWDLGFGICILELADNSEQRTTKRLPDEPEPGPLESAGKLPSWNRCVLSLSLIISRSEEHTSE